MQEVLRNLVKRYVAAMIRDAKTEEGLTEENFKVSIEKWFVYKYLSKTLAYVSLACICLLKVTPNTDT